MAVKNVTVTISVMVDGELTPNQLGVKAHALIDKLLDPAQLQAMLKAELSPDVIGMNLHMNVEEMNTEDSEMALIMGEMMAAAAARPELLEALFGPDAAITEISTDKHVTLPKTQIQREGNVVQFPTKTTVH